MPNWTSDRITAAAQAFASATLASGEPTLSVCPTTLKNGWVLDEAYVIGPTNTPAHVPYIVDGHGEAYVSVATAGSSAPRIKVHWWAEVDGFYVVSLTYWPVVVIRGPKGLPWQ